MNHLHLLIPDLILPKDIAAQVGGDLSLPALEKLLARGARTMLPATTVERFLCERFGVNAAAPVRAVADGLEVADGFWLCADPVHFQVQPSQMVVLPEVAVTADEAAALCAALNLHFAEDSLRFFAPHPERWYVSCDESSRVVMTPLSAAAWRDVRVVQAQGEDALHWLRLNNEMQMLLHGHAVNQARESKGLLTINSMWLWGAGCAKSFHSDFDAVGGDDELSLAFGKAAGIASATTVQALLNSEAANALWVCAAPVATFQRGDLYAWREAMLALEREVAQPVLHALQRGRLQSLTLEVSGETAAQRFELSRGGAWKVWRSRRPLAHFAV